MCNITVLVKLQQLHQPVLIKRYYIDPLREAGFTSEQIKFVSLPNYTKTISKEDKENISIILGKIINNKSSHVLIADSKYYPLMANISKVKGTYGEVHQLKYEGLEHIKVVGTINCASIFYDPRLFDNIKLAINTLKLDFFQISTSTFNFEEAIYPISLVDIESTLQALLLHPTLTCDIEAFSLQINKAHLATIAFSWDTHSGVAFSVDFFRQSYRKNMDIRKLVHNFFTKYTGKLIFHNATYDIKMIVYNLFMVDPLDNEGCITGISTLCRNFEDTKLIAYLCLNSTAGNHLSLKELAFDHVGNYAQEDINDITLIPETELLEYNLTDCCATFFVYNKYKPLLTPELLNLYTSLFLPTVQTLIHTEITGMCLNRTNVVKAEIQLQNIIDESLQNIHASKCIQNFTLKLQSETHIKANEKLKVKVRPISDFTDVTFNPNSPLQLSKLLFTELKLPIIDTTKTNQPSTGNKTLLKLIDYLKQSEEI